MKSFPFRSLKVIDEAGNINYDRPVDAIDYREIFNDLVSDGVLLNPSNNLQVMAGGGDMSVLVNAGKGYIRGNVYWETEQRKLILDAASTLPRIDRVVVRFNDDVDARKTDLYIAKGTPNSVPQAPSLRRDTTVWELCLAEIYVNSNVTKITNSSITDKRQNKELCGIVHGLIDQLDSTTLNQQYEAWLKETREQGLNDLVQSKEGFDNFIADKEGQIQEVLNTRKFSVTQTINIDTLSWKPVDLSFQTTINVNNLKASDIVSISISSDNSRDTYLDVIPCNIRGVSQGDGTLTLEAISLPPTFNLDTVILY